MKWFEEDLNFVGNCMSWSSTYIQQVIRCQNIEICACKEQPESCRQRQTEFIQYTS